MHVKCKDDQLNVELYRYRWLSNCHLGRFILGSECKLSHLFTVYFFHFLIKFGDTLFHDFSLISLLSVHLIKYQYCNKKSKQVFITLLTQKGGVNTNLAPSISKKNYSCH